ncbi:MAG TPA: GNAT family N-acetyltransferase [Pyrinomonadaceae bacterium]|nr:GNAT family N-acetyltransferase [Pyrinomonadaceae bacterium]
MLRPLDEGGEIALRAVRPEDEEFLLDVYASSRADEMALVPWDEAQKRAFLRQQFEAQSAQYFARFPEAEYSIILYKDRPVGRFWTGKSADEIRLLDIAILPEFQNQGIGAVLVRALIGEAERANLPLRHMVFQLNIDALRFYERLGFTPFEEVGAYIHMERVPAAAPQTSSATSRD